MQEQQQHEGENSMNVLTLVHMMSQMCCVVFSVSLCGHSADWDPSGWLSLLCFVSKSYNVFGLNADLIFLETEGGLECCLELCAA